MSLRAVRRRKKLTQRQLADSVGVDQSTISKLENGTTHEPTWDLVSRLAAALEVDPHDLFPTQVDRQAVSR